MLTNRRPPATARFGATLAAVPDVARIVDRYIITPQSTREKIRTSAGDEDEYLAIVDGDGNEIRLRNPL